MKKITNTIAETLLIASFLTLLSIPVIVFGGFSPTVKNIQLIKTVENLENDKVLGINTLEEEKEDINTIPYITEFIPNFSGNITLEEHKKDKNLYEFTVQAYNENADLKGNDFLRIVNTTEDKLVVTIKMINYYNQSQLNNLKLKIDNSAFALSELSQNDNFQPSITLDKGEWITIGLIFEDNIEKPTFFTIQAEFFN